MGKAPRPYIPAGIGARAMLCLERLSAGRFLAVGGNSDRLVLFHGSRLCLDNTGSSLQQCIIRMLLGCRNSALCKRTQDGICFVFLHRNADDLLCNTVFRFLEYLLLRLIGH